MYRCGAETATTERPCGNHVRTPNTRCPAHRGRPLGNVIDLMAWRRARAARVTQHIRAAR